MANKIKIRRGLKAGIPTLAEGELGYAIDTKELFIGTSGGNELVNVDDVLEYVNLSSFPETGEAGKIYIAQDTNRTYRWSGSGYVEISASLALGETSSTAYRGDRGKTAYDHTSLTNNPHSVTKAQVGLSNVDNTSDLNKPISTSQQTALDGKLDKNNAITAGTKPKITYDAKGLVTGGADLVATDIPNLDATKITTGTFGVGRIPALAPSKITQDANNRFVTDTEKSTWNAKQSALGFTPENQANKKTTLTDNDVDYPTTKAVKTYVDGKVAGLMKLKGNLAPGGLVAGLLVKANEGFVYNINSSFTTDALFTEGSGKAYPAGTNVGIVDAGGGTYLFDAMTGIIDTSSFLTAVPQATEIALGGIKAKAKSSETVEVAIDGASGKLYVPTYPTVTDTKNTAGTTNKASTKLFIAGAESQGANPQTYSNSGVYIGTDNELYANSKKLVNTDDTRLTNARTPTSHTHGSLSNDGKLTDNQTKASGFKFVMTDGSNVMKQVNLALGSGTAKYLREDGTWNTPPDTNTTYSVFNTTTDGLVPKTTTSNTTDYLRRDGTWATPPDNDTIYTHPSDGAGTTITAANGKVLSSITVDSLGHTTAVGSKTLVAADIPNLNTSKLTAGTLGVARGGTGRTDGYAVGVVETRASVLTKIWTGTEAQYDAIGTKDANTLYFII